jgi:ankyrin repeat protein
VLHAAKPPSRLPKPCAQANAYSEESNEQYLSEPPDATPNRLSQIFLNPSSKEAHCDKSTSSSDAKSYQASEISIRSLRKRLSLKTESCLGDIVSLMQNFTIGGSSSLSGKRAQRTSSKAFSGTISSNTDVEQHLPTVGELQASSFSGQTSKEHTMPLPGIFSNYHWEEFGELPETEPSYRRYALNRRRTRRPKTLSKTGYEWTNLIATVRDEIVYPKDLLNDIFGNSALHIAAALGKTPKYLLHLLDLHANMHALNSANQTFLHLLQPVAIEDCMDLCSLLNRLQVESFNFHQRDDHGQTPLHLITRPWISWTVLDETAAELHYSKIVLPLSRDNLGRTIIGQLIERGIGKPEIDRLQRRAAAHVRDDRITSKSAVQDAEVDRLCLPNYGNQTFIETVQDLLMYEQHADLLRTIVRACKFPQFEDANGRNGLHCLAEARNLPLPDAAVGRGIEPDIALTSARREAYLEDLLFAGVDTDNHDNFGLTPLMAFILHTREGEDDDTTNRILSRLCEAGANINRRNQKGETPLHIAVKLGRRAATKFLISKKANIQARDSSGMGVVALALAHSKKATQNETLYAQIMLCMSLVVDAGAVSAPTTLQEWAVYGRAL